LLLLLLLWLLLWLRLVDMLRVHRRMVLPSLEPLIHGLSTGRPLPIQIRCRRDCGSLHWGQTKAVLRCRVTHACPWVLGAWLGRGLGVLAPHTHGGRHHAGEGAVILGQWSLHDGAAALQVKEWRLDRLSMHSSVSSTMLVRAWSFWARGRFTTVLLPCK